MTVVCAWCMTVIGVKPGPHDAISHGICQDCLAKMAPVAR